MFWPCLKGKARKGAFFFPILSPNCSNVFGNEDGNYLENLPDQTGISGNISEHPLFCDQNSGNYELAAGSPCLPLNNSCGALMGSLGEGCAVATAAPAIVPSDVSQMMQRIRVFPNPNRGELTLDLSQFSDRSGCEGTLRLRIVDPTGRAVFHGTVDPQAFMAGSAVIDLKSLKSNLASGVYFGRLIDCAGRPHGFRFQLLK